MKNLLLGITLIFGVTTAHASEIETHVVCTPTLASVSVNGVLDVDQTTKLINSAKGAGEFRPLFDEYSEKFKTVQKAAKPHHTWIGINDSVNETQVIAVMNFVTMTYTKTAYTKFWTHEGSERNGVVHSITNHCDKKQIASNDLSAKIPNVNLLGSN